MWLEDNEILKISQAKVKESDQTEGICLLHQILKEFDEE